MRTVDEVLSLSISASNESATWTELDQIIGSLTDVQQQIEQWNKVSAHAEANGVGSGHAHFRLGVLHLINDVDEAVGIDHLERAYEQDVQHAVKTEPQRMAAYRVLGLAKDFINELKQKRGWQATQ